MDPSGMVVVNCPCGVFIFENQCCIFKYIYADGVVDFGFCCLAKIAMSQICPSYVNLSDEVQ